MTEMTLVRVYLTEAEHLLEPLVRQLHDVERVRGLTAFRGILGFGASGQVHTSRLADVRPDLPLVLEFYDSPERAAAIIEHLKSRVNPAHIISWNVQSHS
jgi:hypothetical protein